jgi:hypothetical protein
MHFFGGNGRKEQGGTGTERGTDRHVAGGGTFECCCGEEGERSSGKSPFALDEIQSKAGYAQDIDRPENPAFTVQIGAFARPNNALRNQKLAKTRFPEYPVYNNFLAQAKIYRVSVGKFDTRRDALAAQKQILKKCPKEYTGCWINYIRK